MQFNQSQMCASVTDPGGETWDTVLLQGLAKSAHLFGVCVRVVCVCGRPVFWDVLRQAVWKFMWTCMCSVSGVRKQSHVSH